MGASDTESKLCAVIEEFAKKSLKGIGRDVDLLETLGFDSLSGLRMLAVIEKRFEVLFPNEELSELKSLSAITAAVDRAKRK